MKKKVTITVPSSWSDITVAQYQAITSLDKSAYKTDTRYIIDMVSIICGVDTLSLDAETFAKITGMLGFLGTEIKAEKKEEITIDGKVYRWKSNLNQITVGEMVSIEQVIDLEKLTYNLSYDVIAAVLMREVQEDGTMPEFDSKLFTKYREMLNEVPVTELSGMINFFIAGGRMYTPLSVNYLVVQTTIPTSIQKKNWLSRKLYSLKAMLTQVISGFRS